VTDQKGGTGERHVEVFSVTEEDITEEIFNDEVVSI
jgi:hypothetical protein